MVLADGESTFLDFSSVIFRPLWQQPRPPVSLPQLHHHKWPWSGHAYNCLSYYSFLTFCFLLRVRQGWRWPSLPTLHKLHCWGELALSRSSWWPLVQGCCEKQLHLSVTISDSRTPPLDGSQAPHEAAQHLSHHLHHVHQYHHWLHHHHHPTNLLYFSGVTRQVLHHPFPPSYWGGLVYGFSLQLPHCVYEMCLMEVLPLDCFISSSCSGCCCARQRLNKRHNEKLHFPWCKLKNKN